MGLKKKHRKKLDKIRQKNAEKQKEKQAEIDFDTSAYVIYNNLEFTYPCLSFDILKDAFESGPERVQKYPISFYMVAGAQTPQNVETNHIYVAKVDNIHALKQEDENEKEDDDDDEENDEEEDDPKRLPRLSTIRVPIKGCVNRIRSTKLGGKTFTATWTDKAKVHIHDLTTPVQAVSDLKSIQTYIAQKIENKAIFTFGGHLSEGYAVDWSPTRAGALATGDCKKNIHIWSMKGPNNWLIDQQPLVGHENSVEDIKWSPSEPDILASCSVDKSVRLWDLRSPPVSKCTTAIIDSHRSDVNVIDWNKLNKNLLVSGGDDGVVKVWDLRHTKADSAPQPVAQFSYHSKSITSVEWNPNDETVIAVSSDDDKLTIWDLAVERDEEQELADAIAMETDNKDSAQSSDVDDEILEDEAGEQKDAGDLIMKKEDERSDEEEEDEDDEKSENGDEGVEYGDLDFKKIPEQMLFLHQGQMELKELHWHPQLHGLIISSALNGINIFKTISA